MVEVNCFNPVLTGKNVYFIFINFINIKNLNERSRNYCYGVILAVILYSLFRAS